MGEALPQIHYAHSGDVEIAYTSVGDGPVDLILVWGWLTNLEVYWDEPAFRRFVERLAAFARVIIFDKRGMGLSDRTTLGTLEERMDDVRAVMDAIGSERAVLLGVSEGAPLSLLFAASHPERTQALVFVGGEVKEVISDDWPWGQSTREEYDRYLDDFLVSDKWGKPAPAFFAPSRRDDPALMEWLGRLERSSASPAAAVAFMRMGSHIDVRAVVPSVHVPALVLHSRRDSVVAFEQGRWLADTLPDARFVELTGQDHGPQFDSVDQVIEEVRNFLTGSREPVEPEQVLATILFTDLVGSTERAQGLGDRRWRESWSFTTAPCATSWPGFGDARSTPPGTGSSRASTGPRGRSAARSRFSRRSSVSGFRPGAACTPVNARSSTASSRGSRCTPARGSPPKRGPARCSSPRRCATSSRVRGSSSRIEGSTSSKACRSREDCSPSSRRDVNVDPRRPRSSLLQTDRKERP